MAVYFIANESGAIKIGKSENPSRRFSALQTASDQRLTLLAVSLADDEAALHDRFSAYRIRGEWFQPCPEIMELAERHAVKPKCRPTAVNNIVESLGGRRVVADLCGVTYNAVANWCSWDAFPMRVHLPLTKAYRLVDPADPHRELPEYLFERDTQKAAS